MWLLIAIMAVEVFRLFSALMHDMTDTSFFAAGGMLEVRMETVHGGASPACSMGLDPVCHPAYDLGRLAIRSCSFLPVPFPIHSGLQL